MGTHTINVKVGRGAGRGPAKVVGYRDPDKVRIDRRLRKETTLSLSWIARRLEMGTKSHLTHLLYWQGRKKG